MTYQLYLHIGYPKTGTTSLQRFCAKNDRLLREHGVLYPQTGRIMNAHYTFVDKMELAGPAALDDKPPLQQLVACLEDELDIAGKDAALLSAENFILARNPAFVRDVFANFAVKIIIYLRRHDHFIESAFRQSERATQSPPWAPTVQSYALHRLKRGAYSLNYLEMLRRWEAAFGKQNLIVRPYERIDPAFSIYDDFLGVMGIAGLPGAQNPPRLNTALHRSTLAAISAVQRSTVPAALNQEIVGHLARPGPNQKKDTGEELLGPSDRLSILSFFQRDYVTIAREFLHRQDGVLFREPLPALDPAWRPPSPPDVQDVTDRILEAVVATEQARVQNVKARPASFEATRQDDGPLLVHQSPTDKS